MALLILILALAALAVACRYSKTVRTGTAHALATLGSGLVALGESCYHGANLLDLYDQ